jgi:hypothetical protein
MTTAAGTPTTLICDTMCFYYLGNRTLKKDDIVLHAGETLWYSPVTVLELSSGLCDLEFEKRKTAATAILDSGASLLPDPQNHLAKLFDLTPKDDYGGWAEALKLMSQSTNMDELKKGVEDRWAGVVRKMDPAVARDWRDTIDGQWVQDVLKIQKDTIPGFKEWYDPDPKKRSPTPVPRLRKEQKAEFLRTSDSQLALVQVFLACHERAYRLVKEPKPVSLDRDYIRRLAGKLELLGFYCAVYIQYLRRLLIEGGLPEYNDSGDIELMLYATDDTHIVVTAEKKWVRLAEAAKYPQRVRRVIPH